MHNRYSPRPLRPRVIPASSRGWFRKKLKVGYGFCTMTHGSTNTIVTSITTTNDNDILALGADVGAVLKLGVEQGLRVKLGT